MLEEIIIRVILLVISDNHADYVCIDCDAGRNGNDCVGDNYVNYAGYVDINYNDYDRIGNNYVNYADYVGMYYDDYECVGNDCETPSYKVC